MAAVIISLFPIVGIAGMSLSIIVLFLLPVSDARRVSLFLPVSRVEGRTPFSSRVPRSWQPGRKDVPPTLGKRRRGIIVINHVLHRCKTSAPPERRAVCLRPFYAPRERLRSTSMTAVSTAWR